MLRIFKQPLFLIGFLVICGLLITSFWYSFQTGGHVKKLGLLYDQSGKLLGLPPFTPKDVPPFGTDENGYPLLFIILNGAKYTLLFSLVIGILRTFIGLAVGLIVSVTPLKIKSTPSTLFQAIQTVPISLVLYFILQPAIFDNDKYVFFMDVIRYSGGYSQYPPTTLWDVVLFETILLTAVSVPLVSKMFADEARDLLKKEYVNVSKTLGASKWTQIRKHVLPELMPKVFVVWIQQIIQALLIIGQLGVLQLYFGGTDVIRRAMETDVIPRTNEWSGFIGYQYQNFGATPWTVLIPLAFFFLVILSYNLLLEGFNRTRERQKFSKKMAKRKGATAPSKAPVLQQSDFHISS